MRITNANQLLELKDNTFIGELPKLTNSEINFEGKNNMLVCEQNVNLVNSRIDFHLDNSILYLSSSKNEYKIYISINNNNVCFIGRDNYFNGSTTLVASESQNIIIGDDNLFSYNILIRVADAHLLYDLNTKQRINHSKSIYIGDHVWLGQDLKIFKGNKIGSGSTIGAGSVISNKIIPSNTTFAGAPVRLVHDASFWVGYSTHSWDRKKTEELNEFDSDEFRYVADDTTLDLDKVEYDLNSLNNLELILDYIKTTFLNGGKNRFSINQSKKQKNKISNLFYR